MITTTYPGYKVLKPGKRCMTLEAGDLINTGTPPGVGLGLTLSQYLKEGDVVELTIEGLGYQKQKCVNA